MTATKAVWYYVERGVEWGPFTAAEKREIDATGGRSLWAWSYTWRKG
jgi:hypothetical protein